MKKDTPLIYFHSVINRQDVPLDYFQAPDRTREIYRLSSSMITASSIALDRLDFSTDMTTTQVEALGKQLEQLFPYPEPKNIWQRLRNMVWVLSLP